MKVPAWISAIVYKQVIKSLPDAANTWQDKHAPALDGAFKKITEGGTLREAIHAYVLATESLDDDALLAKVDVYVEGVLAALTSVVSALDSTPFLDVIEQALGGISIPDFDNNPDNDPDNDLTVSEYVKTLLNALDD